MYLTFADQNGHIVGPVRYNSQLVGKGIKLELGTAYLFSDLSLKFTAARFQMGSVKGLEGLTFSAIPKRIEVKGVFIST